MSGAELLEVRNWLMEKTTSESHPLTAMIVDILNEDIKDNILTVDIPQTCLTLPKEQVSELVRKGAKVSVIKIIRGIFGWGLKECKDFMDANWDTWVSLTSKS